MKKILKNPWILGIGTTVIGGIALSFILDWIKGVDWSSTLKAVVNFIVNAIVSFLNFELKVWWILIAVALIVLALFFIAKYYDEKSKNEKPSFLSSPRIRYWDTLGNGNTQKDMMENIALKISTRFVQNVA